MFVQQGRKHYKTIWPWLKQNKQNGGYLIRIPNSATFSVCPDVVVYTALHVYLTGTEQSVHPSTKRKRSMC